MTPGTPIDMHAVALEGLTRDLSASCNKINHGQCITTACLLRGGWRRYQLPPDYTVATCESLERLTAVEALISEVRDLRTDMNLGGPA